MIERRFITAKAECRSEDGDAVLVGYAAKFGVLSSDLGGWREKIAPGAFAGSLERGDDVRFLLNHDPSKILARRKSGTLSLGEDSVGLRFRARLPNTTDGRDAWTLVKRGDISECSFAFTAEDQDWGEDDDPDDRSRRISVRTLRSVRLLDASIVCYPAYPNTSVETNGATAPIFNSLTRALSQLFPQGVPAEVRSHVPMLNVGDDQRERRRTLAARVLSI